MLMKNKIVVIAILFCGIIIGIIESKFFIPKVLSSHRQIIRSEMIIEQEIKASREERKGNNLQALLHRWNAVSLYNPEATYTFSKNKSDESDTGWFASIAYIILADMSKSVDSEGKGIKRAEGVQRGHLAFLMEKLGFKELGLSEWKKAANLQQVDVEKMKSIINYLRENVDDSLQKEAEDSVLGPDIPIQ